MWAKTKAGRKWHWIEVSQAVRAACGLLFKDMHGASMDPPFEERCWKCEKARWMLGGERMEAQG